MDVLHLIDGRWVEGDGEEFADTNPARPGEVVARGRFASSSEVARAVAAARKAAPGWAATPHHARAAVLTAAADLVDAEADAWGAELAREEGKTLPEAVAEVRGAARVLRYHAAEADRENGEVYASPRPGENVLVVRRPVGVAGLITPFNFPVIIPAWKIGPALSHGNTVVWKPSSLVPLLAYRLAQALTTAGLPDGVLNLVYGEAAAGSAIVDHPGVDAVSFTGSTAVGRAVIARCGELGKPVQTEMGGKNASIVLADADLDHAAEQVCLGAFRSTGQKCTATSRLIVDSGVADELLERVAERAARLVVGDPLKAGVDMGPLVSSAARDRVEVGVLHINSESAGTFPYVPFGGLKQSGFGPKGQGRAAREFFTRTVTVYLGAPA